MKLWALQQNNGVSVDKEKHAGIDKIWETVKGTCKFQDNVK